MFEYLPKQFHILDLLFIASPIYYIIQSVFDDSQKYNVSVSDI